MPPAFEFWFAADAGAAAGWLTGALSTGAAATPSILTGPAIPPVDASNVCVTTVLIDTTAGDGAETEITGSADALGTTELFPLPMPLPLPPAFEFWFAAAEDAAGVSGAVINGLIGAVSAITAGEVVWPLGDTGPDDPATDAPASVASAITIISTTGSAIDPDCADGDADRAELPFPFDDELPFEEEFEEELVGPDIADVKEETVVVVVVVVVVVLVIDGFGLDSDPSGIFGLLWFGLPFPSDGPLSLTQITPSFPPDT